jgi:hypothetical protein
MTALWAFEEKHPKANHIKVRGITHLAKNERGTRLLLKG